MWAGGAAARGHSTQLCTTMRSCCRAGRACGDCSGCVAMGRLQLEEQHAAVYDSAPTGVPRVVIDQGAAGLVRCVWASGLQLKQQHTALHTQYVGNRVTGRQPRLSSRIAKAPHTVRGLPG